MVAEAGDRPNRVLRIRAANPRHPTLIRELDLVEPKDGISIGDVIKLTDNVWCKAIDKEDATTVSIITEIIQVNHAED